MIWFLASFATTFFGMGATYFIGGRHATREAENVFGEIMPGGPPMAAFTLAATRTHGGHGLNGTMHVDEDGWGTPGTDFTIAHPPGCNHKRCLCTKAVKRYGNVAHTTQEIS